MVGRRAGMLWGMKAARGLCMVLAALTADCTSQPGATPPATSTSAAAAPEWFVDRARESGLDFVHDNGAAGHLYYPEILPPGVAFVDYDNDGDLDVYLVQSRPLGTAGSPTMPASRGRLFRNDLRVLPDGTRQLHFADVTAESGIATPGFGLGVAAADIDNDGCVDLYLTSFESNQLYRNNCNGTFTDITKKSGTEDRGGFGVSAAFADVDRDGWLDLYVGNNVNYTLANATKCPNKVGVPDYCPPKVYGGQPDRLYKNRGDGTFADVTATALRGGRFGPALGVATADFDGDGWIDIFVANDGQDNLLWMNQRDGTFKEAGLLSGVALTGEGNAEASMGVDAGDFDGDGDDDLIITELTGEGFNLYLNDGQAHFRDASTASGLGAISRPYTGWGTGWFDFDNDGWLDTIAANGTIVTEEGRGTQAFPYDQRKLLLKNVSGRFENVTASAGAVFGLSESGRGLAFGDVDNDGDVDVLIGNDAGPVRLLINNLGNRQHWLGLKLVGDKAPRDMIGARVGVKRSAGPVVWRRARSDGSYASANDPRVLVGLGASTERPELEVRWPDGRSEKWTDVAIDQWLVLKQGSGR